MGGTPIPHAAIAPRKVRGRGFTLVEVMAAILLIAIVLPAVMQGISMATRVAGTVRQKSEAAGLAQAKLNELLATGEWSADGSGDFAPDWPDYRWSSTVSSWDGDTEQAGLELVEVRVVWTSRGSEGSVTVSTLARSSG